jgi:hypothetical protein
MWLQPGENTGDCNILYSVVATTDVLWLQKRQLQNQNVGDCNLVAVWLHPYSSVIAIAKNW